MERMLDDNIVKQIEEVFAELSQPVHLMFFSGAKEKCEYCAETRQLLEEVAPLSEKISLEIIDFEQEPELARQYQVDKIPGLVIAGKADGKIIDYGVHISGIPAGHEFSSLIHGIIRVSNRDSGLHEKTRAYLAGLSKPVHLQVFVTPT